MHCSFAVSIGTNSNDLEQAIKHLNRALSRLVSIEHWEMRVLMQSGLLHISAHVSVLPVPSGTNDSVRFLPGTQGRCRQIDRHVKTLKTSCRLYNTSL